MKYLLTLGLCACSFRMNAAGTDASDGTTIDALACQFSSQTDTCALGMPQNDLVLSGSNSYDTDTGMLNGMAAPHMRLTGKEGPFDALLVRDFHMTLGATLRATGSLPLGVIAFDQIILDGNTRIDVGVGGAGARTTCDNGAVAGTDNGGGASGGGGGGFGANGGGGGAGDSDGSPKAGGAGGMAAPLPKGPLGGCPGAAGGAGDVDGGAGGLAGGAVYLVAKHQVTIAGSAGIQAGGGGGGGGGVGGGLFDNGDTGGGGGGAGGMIFLEAAMIRSTGILAANGGGGGEASGNGESGNAGADAALGSTPAAGGRGGSSSGTDGGNGGAGTGAAQAVTATSSGGGGGGGGSVGFVIVVSPDAQVSASSPPRS
jgi:hypothetical protein